MSRRAAFPARSPVTVNGVVLLASSTCPAPAAMFSAEEVTRSGVGRAGPNDPVLTWTRKWSLAGTTWSPRAATDGELVDAYAAERYWRLSPLSEIGASVGL